MYDDPSPSEVIREGFRWLPVLLIAIALILALTGGLWAVGVFTSGTYGRGQQIKQVNSGENRTGQYNHFFDLKADYDSQVQAAKLAEIQLKAFTGHYTPGVTPDPSGQLAGQYAQDEADLTGAEQQCAATASTYNEDSLKTVTGAQFKAWTLPATLNPKACEVGTP